jgi:hypothetical protein
MSSHCKQCAAVYNRAWRDRPHIRERERIAARNYRKSEVYLTRRAERRALAQSRDTGKNRKRFTPEELKKRRLVQNRASCRRANAKRRATAEGKINGRISSRVWQCLRSKEQRSGGRRWELLVGYSLTDLKRHLERQFSRGMNWHNMGEWHIDHVVPLASFSFSSPDDPAFRAAWALSNLRPLWGLENVRKRDQRITLL